MKAKHRAPELPKRVGELKQAAEKLRADLATLRSEARRIGHDLNNVLQAIIGDTERIAENESERVEALAEAVLLSTSRGVDLTRELLAIGHGGTKTAAAPVAAPPRSGRPERSPGSVAPARILVVEDQEPIREYTRWVLAKAGYDVAVVANGAEAVAAVRDTDVDLVLMDVHLPVMDGLAATRNIRALESPRSKVPIIAISGNVQPDYVGSLLAAGMSDHIGKPFQKVALFERIDFWLAPSARTPAAASGPGTDDRAAFNEVCELMGRPWAVRGLTKLRAQIDEAFGADLEGAGRVGQLAGQAHALASLAALLGFSTLSQLCSTLEEACRSGHDVRRPFEQAKAAATLAHKTAADLIAGC